MTITLVALCLLLKVFCWKKWASFCSCLTNIRTKYWIRWEKCPTCHIFRYHPPLPNFLMLRGISMCVFVWLNKSDWHMKLFFSIGFLYHRKLNYCIIFILFYASYKTGPLSPHPHQHPAKPIPVCNTTY